MKKQEKYRQTIYCDFDFLKMILSKPENISDLENSLKTEMVVCFRNLILSPDVTLHIITQQNEYDKVLSDINRKQVKAAKRNEKAILSDFERMLFDLSLNQLNNTSHLKIESKKIQFDDTILQENNLNAVYFSSETKDVCQQAMQDYGVIVVCEAMIEDYKNLLFDNGAAIRKWEETDWKNVFKENDIITCNSLIIIDNYLFNDGDLLKENLTSLLDAILPKSLKDSVIFEITIFATLEDDKGNKTFDIKNRYDQVIKILQTIRPQIQFSLSILKCEKGRFHDRNIASGNLYVSSGGGFNLFKDKKSQKTTIINSFYPFFYNRNNWARKAYSDLLCEASSLFKNASKLEDISGQYRSKNFLYGTKKNRLLDF